MRVKQYRNGVWTTLGDGDLSLRNYGSNIFGGSHATKIELAVTPVEPYEPYVMVKVRLSLLRTWKDGLALCSSGLQTLQRAHICRNRRRM